MLRALGRGRALAEGQAGATRAGYLAALRDVARAYPDDLSSVEARWLLGVAAESEDHRIPEAIARWRSIPGRTSSGWLPARLAIASENTRVVSR